MSYRAPIIALVLVVLLGIGFFFLLWQPRNDDLEDIRAETAQLETQRGQLQNELRRLQEIQEREPEFRAALARLEEYLPTGLAQATAIRQFQLTADAAGVTITSVAFSSPAVVADAPPTGSPDTVLAQVTVTMNVEGGYFQAADFFRRLEVDVPRALLVESLGMGQASDGFPVLANTWSGKLFTVVPDPEVIGQPPPDEEPDDDADVEVDVDDADDGDDGEEV